MSVVSAPSAGVSGHSVAVGTNGFEAGGGGAWHVQYRYTPGLPGKSGCSAMPRSPRSDAELTARSSTVLWTAPFTTCAAQIVCKIIGAGFVQRTSIKLDTGSQLFRRSEPLICFRHTPIFVPEKAIHRLLNEVLCRCALSRGSADESGLLPRPFRYRI